MPNIMLIIEVKRFSGESLGDLRLEFDDKDIDKIPCLLNNILHVMEDNPSFNIIRIAGNNLLVDLSDFGKIIYDNIENLAHPGSIFTFMFLSTNDPDYFFGVCKEKLSSDVFKKMTDALESRSSTDDTAIIAAGAA